MNTNSILKLCLLFSFFSCHQEITDLDHKEWKKHETPTYKIEYPSHWELDLSTKLNTSFIILSPKNGVMDFFKENINLIVQDLTGLNYTLDVYTTMTENYINFQLPEGKIIVSNRLTKNNMACHQLIYTGVQNMRKLKFEQYYWIVNDKIFLITFTCTNDTFNDYQSIGEKIIKTFVIK